MAIPLGKAVKAVLGPKGGRVLGMYWAGSAGGWTVEILDHSSGEVVQIMHLAEFTEDEMKLVGKEILAGKGVGRSAKSGNAKAAKGYGLAHYQLKRGAEGKDDMMTFFANTQRGGGAIAGDIPYDMNAGEETALHAQNQADMTRQEEAAVSRAIKGIDERIAEAARLKEERGGGAITPAEKQAEFEAGIKGLGAFDTEAMTTKTGVTQLNAKRSAMEKEVSTDIAKAIREAAAEEARLLAAAEHDKLQQVKHRHAEEDRLAAANAKQRLSRFKQGTDVEKAQYKAAAEQIAREDKLRAARQADELEQVQDERALRRLDSLASIAGTEAALTNDIDARRLALAARHTAAVLKHDQDLKAELRANEQESGAVLQGIRDRANANRVLMDRKTAQETRALATDMDTAVFSVLEDWAKMQDTTKDRILVVQGAAKDVAKSTLDTILKPGGSILSKSVDIMGSATTKGGEALLSMGERYVQQRIGSSLTRGRTPAEALKHGPVDAMAPGGWEEALAHAAKDLGGDLSKLGAEAMKVAQSLGPLGFLAAAAVAGIAGITAAAVAGWERSNFSSPSARKRYDEAKQGVQADIDIGKETGQQAYDSSRWLEAIPFVGKWASATALGAYQDKAANSTRGKMANIDRVGAITGDTDKMFADKLGLATQQVSYWVTMLETTQKGSAMYNEALAGLTGATNTYQLVLRAQAQARVADAVTFAAAGGGVSAMDAAELQNIREARGEILKKLKRAGGDAMQVFAARDELAANVRAEGMLQSDVEGRGAAAKVQLGMVLEQAGLLNNQEASQANIARLGGERDRLQAATEAAVVNKTEVFFDGLAISVDKAKEALVGYEREMRRQTDARYAASPEAKRDRAKLYYDGLADTNVMDYRANATYARASLVQDAAYAQDQAANAHTDEERMAALGQMVSSLKAVRASAFAQVQTQFQEEADLDRARAARQVISIDAEMAATVATGKKVTAQQVNTKVAAVRAGMQAEGQALARELTRLDLSDDHRRKLEEDFQSLKTQYLYAESSLRLEEGKKWVEQQVAGLDRARSELEYKNATSQMGADTMQAELFGDSVNADYSNQSALVIRKGALGRAVMQKGMASGDAEMADQGRGILAEAAGEYVDFKAQFFGTMKFAANKEFRDLIGTVSVGVDELDALLLTESKEVLGAQWDNATKATKTYADEVRNIGTTMGALAGLAAPAQAALMGLFTNAKTPLDAYIQALAKVAGLTAMIGSSPASITGSAGSTNGTAAGTAGSSNVTGLTSNGALYNTGGVSTAPTSGSWNMEVVRRLSDATGASQANIVGWLDGTGARSTDVVDGISLHQSVLNMYNKELATMAPSAGSWDMRAVQGVVAATGSSETDVLGYLNRATGYSEAVGNSVRQTYANKLAELGGTAPVGAATGSAMYGQGSGIVSNDAALTGYAANFQNQVTAAINSYVMGTSGLAGSFTVGSGIDPNQQGAFYGYAGGGIVQGPAGVDKVPAWLTRHEDVKTEGDPFHRWNLGLTADAMAIRMATLMTTINHGGSPTFVVTGNSFSQDYTARDFVQEFANELTTKGLV